MRQSVKGVSFEAHLRERIEVGKRVIGGAQSLVTQALVMESTKTLDGRSDEA